MTGTQAKEPACACRGTEKSEKRGTASGKVPPLPDFVCREVGQRIEKYDINIPKNRKTYLQSGNVVLICIRWKLGLEL